MNPLCPECLDPVTPVEPVAELQRGDARPFLRFMHPSCAEAVEKQGKLYGRDCKVLYRGGLEARRHGYGLRAEGSALSESDLGPLFA
jgi:hypothetical protein